MFFIDAHQHVWDPRRAAYDWLDDGLAPINRPIGFDELKPSLARAGIAATVLVESADNDEDTELMLECADANQEIVGIVAFAPLDDAERMRQRLDELSSDRRVVGVRNLIHNNPDPDWLLRPDVDAGLGVLEELGLTFDLVGVLPRHLELVPELAARHPRLRIVIDHLAKPPIGLNEREPWWSLIAAAAVFPSVYGKVSGLYSATPDAASWTPDVVRPFFRRAIDVFGADRLMYGGDWPISITAGGYDRVWDALSGLVADLDDQQRAAILGGTAKEFYGLDAGLIAALQHVHPLESSD